MDQFTKTLTEAGGLEGIIKFQAQRLTDELRRSLGKDFSDLLKDTDLTIEMIKERFAELVETSGLREVEVSCI